MCKILTQTLLSVTETTSPLAKLNYWTKQKQFTFAVNTNYVDMRVCVGVRKTGRKETLGYLQLVQMKNNLCYTFVST